VTITNHSAFPVRVTGVFFTDPAEKRPLGFLTGPYVGLPKTIPSKDSVECFGEMDELIRRLRPPTGPTIAWVQLSTGDVLKSSPTDVASALNDVHQLQAGD
jgi:hypothetical protein